MYDILPPEQRMIIVQTGGSSLSRHPYARLHHLLSYLPGPVFGLVLSRARAHDHAKTAEYNLQDRHQEELP